MIKNYKFALRFFVAAMAVLSIASCSDDGSTEEGDVYNNYYTEAGGIYSMTTLSNYYSDGLPAFGVAAKGYTYEKGEVSFISDASESSSATITYQLNPSDATIDDVKSWALVSSDYADVSRSDYYNDSYAATVKLLDGGKLEVTVTDTESFDADDQVYALVAKYSDDKSIYSDFARFSNVEALSETVYTEVTDLKLTYDGEAINEGPIVLTQQYTINSDLYEAYGLVGEEWISFDELGFEGSSVDISLVEEDDYLSFTYDYYTPSHWLTLNSGEYTDANLTAYLSVELLDGESTVAKSYTIEFKTVVEETIFESDDRESDENVQYYVDGDLVVDGDIFADWENWGDYTTSFTNDNGDVYGGGFSITTAGNSDSTPFGFTVTEGTLTTTGWNTVRIIFTNGSTGKIYIYIYRIYVMPTPVLYLPTLVDDSTYGQTYSGSYEISAPLSTIFSSYGYSSTNDPYVTYEINIVDGLANLYDGESNKGTTLTGKLIDLQSDLADYRVKYNTMLSNPEADVEITVKIYHSEETQATSDAGYVTFKNPLSLTTSTSEYFFTEKSCTMSKDVVVMFKTDSNPSGEVVYQVGATTGDAEAYGVTVSYSTEEKDCAVNGSTLTYNGEESSGSKYFDVKVFAKLNGANYASASQSVAATLTE